MLPARSFGYFQALQQPQSLTPNACTASTVECILALSNVAFEMYMLNGELAFACPLDHILR